MSTRIIQQPNKYFAIFSTVVDDIVEYNLEQEQVLQSFCRNHNHTIQDGFTEIRKAIQEPSRFEQCLEAIEIRYGLSRKKSVIKQCSGITITA